MWKPAIASAGVLLLAVLCVPLTDAHKPITSKYTYNDDVFPIVRERCARCHVAGGIAPMSLTSYKDAIPWAESIRLELMAGHMPPWFADIAYGDIPSSHRLSPRELDIVMTWASGGVPEGPAKILPRLVLENGWRIGAPDLVLPMPSEFTLAPEQKEAVAEFMLGAADGDRWIRAADILPGTPAIVRSATIRTSNENEIADWQPGDDVVSVPAGYAFRWAKGETLTLQVRYVKPWTMEGKSSSDRSSVGLYFAAAGPLREVQAVTSVTRSLRLLAVEIEGGEKDKDLKVDAVQSDGTRIPLIHVLEQPDWTRRYWLGKPLNLIAGTRIVTNGDPKARVLLNVTVEDTKSFKRIR